MAQSYKLSFLKYIKQPYLKRLQTANVIPQLAGFLAFEKKMGSFILKKKEPSFKNNGS